MAVIVASTTALTAAIAANAAAQSAMQAHGHPMPVWASMTIVVAYGLFFGAILCVGIFDAVCWLRVRCRGAWERWCTRA